MTDTTPTLPDREQLLSLCESGFVPEERWSNRDSSSAHRQLGEAYALLKAGCDFTVYDQKHKSWWVAIQFKGFDAFEYGEHHTTSESFYIPTAESIARADGGDWY